MKKIFLIIFAAIITVSAIAQDISTGDAHTQKKKKSANVKEAESLFDYTKQVVSSNASFRFAIVANPEINSKDTVNSPLWQAIKEIRFRTDIAFVIVLGNLTADGTSASLDMVHEMLNKMDKQYYVIPGKKDINILNAGGTEFKRIFGDDCFRANVNGIFFLGLNTTVPNGFTSGHFLPQKATWLKNQLKNAGKKIPIYVFTTNTLNGWSVDNWYTITDMLRHYNVQLMIDNQNGTYTCSTTDGIPLRGVESLPKSYTICRVHNDTMFMDRKELKAKATAVDTSVIEAKMYLEPNLDLRPAGSNVSDKKEWQFQTPAAVYTKVSTNEKCCYFGDDRGVVYCLDLKKGKMKWKYQTAQRIITQPMVIGDLVIVGSCDKSLYCFNATSGAFLWRVRTGRPIINQPAVVGNRVYIDKNDTMLFCIDLITGEEYRPVRRETIEMPPFEMPKNGNTPLPNNEYISSNIDGIITKFIIK